MEVIAQKEGKAFGEERKVLQSHIVRIQKERDDLMNKAIAVSSENRKLAQTIKERGQRLVDQAKEV